MLALVEEALGYNTGIMGGIDACSDTRNKLKKKFDNLVMEIRKIHRAEEMAR